MKLQTHEYQINYLSVVLPKELISDKNIRHLQNFAVDEYARLKDGIELNYDSLSELEADEDSEIEQNLLNLISYLLNNFKHIDAFVFTP